MTARVGVIGFGAIAQWLVSILIAQDPAPRFSVLVRPGRARTACDALSDVGLREDALITSDLNRFLEGLPVFVAEYAGHGAVTELAVAILERGVDLVVSSVGALADAALLYRLSTAPAGNSGQIILPSGAVGGVDLLGAARFLGLTSVRYTGRNPRQPWLIHQPMRNTTWRGSVLR